MWSKCWQLGFGRVHGFSSLEILDGTYEEHKRDLPASASIAKSRLSRAIETFSKRLIFSLNRHLRPPSGQLQVPYPATTPEITRKNSAAPKSLRLWVQLKALPKKMEQKLDINTKAKAKRGMSAWNRGIQLWTVIDLQISTHYLVVMFEMANLMI